MNLRFRRFIAGAILIVGSFAVFGGERSAVWTRLYRRAESLEDRMTVMQSAVRKPSADLVPMLVQAITELNSEREQLESTTARIAHTELSKLVVRTLGEVGAVEAADLVFDVVRNATDPFLRGEAIFTLGRIGAREYSDDVAMILRNLNLNINAERDDRDAEIIAFAAILSLERLREPVAYPALFFASIGWYSPVSGVRTKAREVMETLLKDPTEVLSDIIRLETDLEIKLEGLQAEIRSNAPVEGKAEIAMEALNQSFARVPQNAEETTMIARIRLLSMETMIANGAQSDDSVDQLMELVERGADINERLTAIQAVGVQRSEYAVVNLVSFLKKQNDRQLSGVTPTDYRVIRTTIQVLGELGGDLAEEELLAVQISNWPNSIIREAEAALEKFGE